MGQTWPPSAPALPSCSRSRPCEGEGGWEAPRWTSVRPRCWMASKVLWAHPRSQSRGAWACGPPPPSHRAFPPGTWSDPPRPSRSLPGHRETAEVEVVQSHALDGPAPLEPRTGASSKAPGPALPSKLATHRSRGLLCGHASGHLPQCPVSPRLQGTALLPRAWPILPLRPAPESGRVSSTRCFPCWDRGAQ